MFLLIFCIVLLSIITLLIIYPFRKSWIYILTYLDILLLLSGYLVFIIKTGGYGSRYSFYFLFSDSLVRQLNNIYIPLFDLYYLITLARLFFPYLLLCSVLLLRINAFKSQLKQRLRTLYPLIPLVLFAIFLHPNIFYRLLGNRFEIQDLFQSFVSLTLMGYCLAALILFISEIKTTQLRWYKTQNLYLTIASAALLIVYLIFALMDPVMIIQDYSTVRVGPINYFLNSKIDALKLFTITLLMAISLLVNYIAMWKFAKIDYDKDRLELMISRNLKEAKVISSGLIHGLKNQILTEKVMSMNLVELLSKESGSETDRMETLELAQALLNEHNTALHCIDLVYKSLRDIKTHLVLDDLADLFAEIQETTFKKYPDRKILFDVSEGKILADRQLLVEAIMNLIDNAVDATKGRPDGVIEVTVGFSKVFCVMTVQDNGIGIDAKLRKKLFLPFITNKNMRSNWGFGLCYTRQVINKHLGEIRFESSPGVGTTFYVTLPKLLRGE